MPIPKLKLLAGVVGGGAFWYCKEEAIHFQIRAV